jgi:hypothetical protein
MINVHNPSKTKDLYFLGNVLSIRYTITQLDDENTNPNND